MAFSTDPSDTRLAPPSTPGAATAATPNRRERNTEATPGRLSARRPTAATPHGRAAYAALQRRRTALFTPGKERRRSLRDQRETPRDPLRALSRLLAPSSQAIHSSSSPSDTGANSSLPVVAEGHEDEDFSDDFEIERPRLSLNLNEDDDLDSELKPPRLSGLEEADYTAQSIELPRRVPADAARSSLGSARYSDYVGADLRSDDVGIDSGFFPPPVVEEDEDGMVFDDPGDLDRSDANELRRQTLRRDSLFPPMEFPDAANESTFVMAPMESSPAREPMFMDEDDNESDQALADGPSDAPDGTPEADRTGHGEPSGLLELGEEEESGVIGNQDADATLISQAAGFTMGSSRRRKPGKKISKHGIEYPSLPQGVVKRLATTFARTAGASKSKLAPDTLDAIMQATDWFFEQLGDDLQAYSKHAGRKTIDESDMMTLMRRQRQTSASTTPFALAQRYLPRELLQEVRLPVPAPVKGSKRKKPQRAGAEDAEVAVT